MRRSDAVSSTITLMLFCLAGLFVAAPRAAASPVQITLNNLTFSGSDGSEVFTGSFLYDSSSNVMSSVNITASGIADVYLGALDFGGVTSTGDEPNEFAFNDGYGDTLLLDLPSGLSASSYDFTNVFLYPFELTYLGFTPDDAACGDYCLAATSGSFSISGVSMATTPEPSSLLLLFTGMVLLGLSGAVRRLGPSEARAAGSISR